MKSFFTTTLLSIGYLYLNAQVQINKPISLNGSTAADRRISNLADPTAADQAVNTGVVQTGALIFAAETGAANAYVVNLSPAATAYTTGMVVNFIVGATHGNTGASTLQLNTLTPAKTIKKSVGTDIASGDIAAGQMVSVIYDGTNFQLLSSALTTDDWTQSGSNLYSNNNTWNVGIGNTSPSAKLDVTGSARFGDVSAQRFVNIGPTGGLTSIYTDNNLVDMIELRNYDGTAANRGTGIRFASGDLTSTFTSGRIISGTEGAWSSTLSTQDAFMAFNTALDGAMNERMRINSLGFVGIGTSQPNTLLTLGAPMTTTSLTPMQTVNTTGSKPFFAGETSGNKGVMIGYGGNDIQGRTGSGFVNNGDLLLNQYGGNVGIGITTAPTTRLEISGGLWDKGIAVMGRGATTYNSLGYDTRISGLGNNPPLIIDQDGTLRVAVDGYGNLGVGTAAPGGKIGVQGPAYSQQAITWPDYDVELNTNSFISYRSDAGGNGLVATAGTGPSDVLLLAGNYYDSRAVITIPGSGGSAPADQGTGRGKDLMIIAGKSDNGPGLVGGRTILQGGSGYTAGGYGGNYGAVVLQPLGGNIGIGVAAPTDKLHINGGNINLGGNGDPSGDQGNNWLAWGLRADGNPYYCVRTQYKAYTPPVPGGVNNTYSRLQLNWHTGIEIGGSSSYGGTRFYDASPGMGGTMVFSVADGNSHVRVTNNLGIGVNPVYALQVNGQPAANGYLQFTNYSDSRLKRNIADIDNSLDKIMKLRPVQFNYNEEYLKIYDDTTALTRLQKGFIAQEVKEIFPEMVGSVNIKNKAYYDLNLSNLQVYMVKAMQQQQEIINAQGKDIEVLKNTSTAGRTDKTVEQLEKENEGIKATNQQLVIEVAKLKEQLNLINEKLGLEQKQ